MVLGGVWRAAGLTEGAANRAGSEGAMSTGWFDEGNVCDRSRRGEFSDSHSVAALALYDLYDARARG